MDAYRLMPVCRYSRATIEEVGPLWLAFLDRLRPHRRELLVNLCSHKAHIRNKWESDAGETDLCSYQVPDSVLRESDVRRSLAVVGHEHVYRSAKANEKWEERLQLKQKAYGSSLYTSCPSSFLSRRKRSSRATMTSTSRARIAFSFGRMIWRLTYDTRRSTS